MQGSSRNPRYLHTLCVALLVVVWGAISARAEPPVDAQGRPLATQTRSSGASVPDEVNCLTVVDPSGAAQSGDFWSELLTERSQLTGDWWGGRTTLDEQGITFDLSTTQFYQGVTRGGQAQGFRYGGRNDYFLNLEGEKLGLWTGTSISLHGESRYGQSVNSLAGTLATPNLMLSLPQTDGTVTALTGVTFTQLLSEKVMVYGGKFNTFDDVEQPFTGAGCLEGFQNTAMLYNPVFARTVPYSTFGAGFAYLPDEESVISVTVYDTNDTPTVSGFDTFFDNGATVFIEWNMGTNWLERPGHQGLSGTYSTGKYTNLEPTAFLDPIEGLVVATTLKRGSWSLAYNFDQALYVSPDDPDRMWGGFGNFGIADENPSPVRWFASVGVSGSSPLSGRSADSFGVAYYFLGVSEPLKDLAPQLLPLRDEQGVDLYYNVAVTPWCRITPDLQVIAPFRDQLSTSVIAGVRAQIVF